LLLPRCPRRDASLTAFRAEHSRPRSASPPSQPPVFPGLVAAIASGGEIIAARTNAAAQGKPISAWATTATTAVVNKTSPIANNKTHYDLQTGYRLSGRFRPKRGASAAVPATLKCPLPAPWREHELRHKLRGAANLQPRQGQTLKATRLSPIKTP